eukprot:7453139-Pyramimonas_sp.AAC.1
MVSLFSTLHDVADHQVGQPQLHAALSGARVGQDAAAAHARVALLVAAAPCKAARAIGCIAVLSSPGLLSALWCERAAGALLC